jgi:hypothetical protein
MIGRNPPLAMIEGIVDLLTAVFGARRPRMLKEDSLDLRIEMGTSSEA